MVPWAFGVPLVLVSALGLILNGYVLLVVLGLGKQTQQQQTANTLLLIHLGAVEAAVCLILLIFTTGSWPIAGTWCVLHGFLLTLLHPVALWTVTGLNCDRLHRETMQQSKHNQYLICDCSSTRRSHRVGSPLLLHIPYDRKMKFDPLASVTFNDPYVAQSWQAFQREMSIAIAGIQLPISLWPSTDARSSIQSGTLRHTTVPSLLLISKIPEGARKGQRSPSNYVVEACKCHDISFIDNEHGTGRFIAPF
ncbi:hypothetical protein K0M31_011476 [Melipona bicolor]|uniref:Uncharacterized protein n=1 Tax=Melipona bicolor TaxID=60889 RepID=A0AA40G9K5_9HYME|nr:hypothetical protein K0M31_011476 [Melipona bicolor]